MASEATSGARAGEASAGATSAPSAPASTAAATGAPAQQSVEAEDDDADDGEDDEDAADGATGADGLTAKQRKKQKYRQKLKKKLGMAGKAEGTSETTASSEIAERDLSDEMLKTIKDAVSEEQGPSAAAKVNRANLAKLLAAMNLERDTLFKRQEEKARKSTQKQIAEHKFWKTQPVAKPDDGPIEQDGPIEPNQPRHLVRQEPLPLPPDFEWVQVDIDNPEQLKEVYELLIGNYIEDDEASMRFRYSPEFLNWVLRHPGFLKTWHVGVRVQSTGKMVAFISGIPHELRVREQSYHSVEINFLCVHKKLRSKRLAPVLIKEVTRRCHLEGIFQAIYTGGVVLPTPMSCARYYHRTLNPQKLLEIGFAGVPHGMSVEQWARRYVLPTQTSTKGLREIREGDVKAVGKLMRRFMRKYDMAPRFTDEEIRHLFLSGRGDELPGGKRERQVTWTYVVESDNGRITDMFSFYSLPSSILNNPKHDAVNASYLFYYATDVGFAEHRPSSASDAAPTASSSSSAPPSAEGAYARPPAAESTEGLEPWQKSHITGLSTEEAADEDGVLRWDHEDRAVKAKIKARLNELMNDLLILAKQAGFDVVNCLTIMDNPLFLSDQKFGPGDGFLRFYLFNWRVKPVQGGLGSRAGESEYDPVAHYVNAQHKALAANGGGSKGSVQDEIARALRTRQRPEEFGTGNGIVMV